MKQKFFDLNLVETEWKVFSIFATVAGFVLSILGTPKEFNIWFLIATLIVFILIYIIIFFYYRFWCTTVKLKIGKVDLTVKVGDMFNQDGMKVIPMNEYFDTQVDDIIISQTSLNGLYVNKYSGFNNVAKLNEEISKRLKEYPFEKNNERKNGKQKKYPIGTTIVIDKFILTALTKFNEINEAHLSMQEYLNFLNNFWNEINRVHNGRVINVPIMGTGISRINPVLTEQEYLEQIILSLKTSTLITSKSKINIIVYDGDKSKISLSRLKSVFYNINARKGE
ncbi:MAG: hypothetical protein IKV94_01710 [Clostridia bacterium]|nr:hypothetical protein [Clostridia bacterium]